MTDGTTTMATLRRNDRVPRMQALQRFLQARDHATDRFSHALGRLDQLLGYGYGHVP